MFDFVKWPYPTEILKIGTFRVFIKITFWKNSKL